MGVEKGELDKLGVLVGGVESFVGLFPRARSSALARAQRPRATHHLRQRRAAGRHARMPRAVAHTLHARSVGRRVGLGGVTRGDSD